MVAWKAASMAKMKVGWLEVLWGVSKGLVLDNSMVLMKADMTAARRVAAMVARTVDAMVDERVEMMAGAMVDSTVEMRAV